MKLSVEHSTVYRYDYAVILEPHTIRLRPRMTSAQRLLAFEMQILPVPSGTTECLDQDGIRRQCVVRRADSGIERAQPLYRRDTS